ncbi:MAG: hypothetical protein V7L29_28830 [Nostoc sp.]
MKQDGKIYPCVGIARRRHRGCSQLTIFLEEKVIALAEGAIA